MLKQTRREFLEQSMFAAAAALGAGSALSREMFAAETPKGPNDILRVAVLGVRGRGQAHLGAYLKDPGCEIVAIVDPDEAIGYENGVKTVEKAQGKKPAYHKDMRKVMDDQSIDIVSIATPNHWHALAAIWAIQSGKDVYVEKPVSHNVSEGRRVVQAAEKYEKIVQTGTQIRSSTGVQEAIKYIQSGKIGDVNLARGLCYNERGSIGARGSYDVPASVDYNLWTGPAPIKRLTRQKLHYDWHWVWDTGNGDLGNQGIHQMDLCRWGLGVRGLGQSVLSYGGRLSYIDAGETANTQVSIINYGEKRIVFEVRGLKTKKLKNTDVGAIYYGTDGYVVINKYSGGAAFDPQGNVLKHFDGGGDHFKNFIAAVRNRKREDLNADILEGHLSSALCHLGNISYRLGAKTNTREIEERLAGDKEALETFARVTNHLADNKVDLVKTKLQFGVHLPISGRTEVFIGPNASTADPWLTREYRKPFVVPSEKEV